MSIGVMGVCRETPRGAWRAGWSGGARTGDSVHDGPRGRSKRRGAGRDGAWGDRCRAAAGSDSVQVTRRDASTWQVQSQAGHDLALCENNGQLYSMPVNFTIVSSTPLP